MARAQIVGLAALFILSGCYMDAKGTKITEQNKDSYLDALNDSHGLTVGETRELIAFQFRTTMASTFSKEAAPSVVGKTVGDLIKEQRDWEVAQKTKKEQDDKLAAEAKKREDDLAELLRSSIKVSVYEKGFHKADFREGTYQDLMTFKLVAENVSKKPIRAFQGDVKFDDLFGDNIYTVNLKQTQSISPGGKYTWNASIDYNQFEKEHQRLRDTDLKDMKLEWRPAQVIFADGTKVGGESSEK